MDNQVFFKNYLTTCIRFRYHWTMYVKCSAYAGLQFLATLLVCTGFFVSLFSLLEVLPYLAVFFGVVVGTTTTVFLTKLYPMERLAAKHKFLSNAYVDMIPVFVQELRAKEPNTLALDLLANKFESVAQVEKDYNLPLDQDQMTVATAKVYKETGFC